MKNFWNNIFMLPLVAFLFCISSAKAQYVLEWAYPFGGDGWDEANTCLETRDGDLMMAGFAKQQQQNLWVVKMNSEGKGRWGKILPDYQVSVCHSMIQDHDANIMLCGYAIKKNEYQSNLLLIKMDTLGNILWHKTYGGKSDEVGYKVIEAKGGGYAVCGYSSSNQDGEPNWYMLRVDNNGKVIWERQFGYDKDDRAMSIAQTYDESYVVTGYIGNENSAQKMMMILKLAFDGSELWEQRYDVNDWSCGTAIISTRDSMIVAAGYTRPYAITDYDVLVVKTDQNGDTIWTRTYGNEDWQEATDLVETYDNAFVVGGFSMSNIKDHSSFLMLKYDTKGNLIWHDVFKRKSQDYSKAIIETKDHGLLLAGTTFSFGKGWDMAVLKLKNVESTELFFSFPADSLSTTLVDQLTFNFCLNSFGVPNVVKVLVNDKVQMVDSDFKKPTQNKEGDGCDFPLSYTVQLEPGYNEIKLEIRDYKNFSFKKKIEVYQLPSYEFVR